MTHRVLVCGLPGAGKTTLSARIFRDLQKQGYSVLWLNADRVREQFNDWDFSPEGRLRQSVRMREIADQSGDDIVIADFVAPLVETRANYDAHTVIWVDTIREGRFEDTNRAFVPPETFDIRVTEQDAAKWAALVAPIIAAKTDK